MKKATQKILALFLVTALILSSLAGCGQPGNDDKTTAGSEKDTTAAGDDGTTEEPTTEQSLFNVGSLPIVNEPITLKVLTQDKTSGKAGDALIWEWLEEQTGIHFEVESYSADDLASKLPLIMATPEEMPDLFFRCDFSEADVVQYGQNGQLLQLDDLIEQYGTNIKEMFEGTVNGYGASVASDGHIYSLPAMNGKATFLYYAINTRFLENSGIESIPSTLEELYDAMVIMRQCDANGDGIVGNEVLWSSTPKAFKRQALGMVGISCYWPWEGCLFDDRDGEVYFVPTSEEYKYLLTVLRDMYAIGAIDQEIFTQTSNQYKAKFKADLTFLGESIDNPESSSFSGITGGYYAVPFTSAVHDEPTIIIGADYQVNIGSIAGNTEYPEICMLLLDFLYSYDASWTNYWGQDGIDYKLVSKDPLKVETVGDITLNNGPTSLLLPRWIRDDFRTQESTTLARQRAEMVAEYGRFGWQNYVKLTVEEADSISIYSADLGLHCDDYYVGFITGTYDIEKDWDKYVQACESMHMEDLVKVYQAAYDRYFGEE